LFENDSLQECFTHKQVPSSYRVRQDLTRINKS